MQKWCNSCAVRMCNYVRRKTQVPKQKATLRPISMVMDIPGLVPESKAGNKYILVVGDYFTKWMEVYSIPNVDAITVATIFSVPRHIHSDQRSLK